MVNPKVSLQSMFLVFALPLVALGCGGGEVEKQDTGKGSSAEKPARAPQIDFLKPEPIGNATGGVQAMITNLTIVDLDQNGLMDVIVADTDSSSVRWLAQDPTGTYTEKVLGDPIKAVAHVAAFDVDKDGDLDVLVASMGEIAPTNEEIGAVVFLENDGQQNFTNHELLGGVARVTDVEAGDFDGDGDVDIVAGQFGYDTGEIRWMENIGDGWTYRSHILQSLSGTIHTPVADIDGDGDLDIVALVSQEWEEIYVFENDGKAAFTPRLIFGSTNEDFGSSGMNLADLDGDGDLDVLFTNGDSFDYLPPGPRPWHGVQWLENKGDLNFGYHRIDDFAGASSAHAADVDNDGDQDIVMTSSLGQDEFAEDASMIWFENDGAMKFTRRDITRDPGLLVVMAPGDMDGDGKIDFVTGIYPSAPPVDIKNRVVLWRNQWSATPAPQPAAQP